MTEFDPELLLESNMRKESCVSYDDSPTIAERPFYRRVFGEEHHVEEDENMQPNVLI